MKFPVVLGMLLLGLSHSKAHASAYVQLNYPEKTITVSSKLHFYARPGLAIDDLAKEAAESITAMWNEPVATLRSGTHDYRIQFKITYDVNQIPLPSERTCEDNIIRITDQDLGSSYCDHLGGARATLMIKDLLKSRTTAAHEYGHLLGLDHAEDYQLKDEAPGIMFFRGTYVLPKYQYDPAAGHNQKGGTVDPNYRKVRVEDVQAVRLWKIINNGNTQGCLQEAK